MPWSTTYLEDTVTESIKTDVSYVAFCSDSDNPGRDADISTALEIDRIAPTSTSRTDNVISITGTPSSKITFDIDNPVNFNVGDRVEVYLNSYSLPVERKIVTISTNTITLDRDLPYTPISGDIKKE